jgi:hypothetical protein
MIKLGVAILGLMTVPVFVWLLVPALMVVAVLSPFLFGLAVYLVAGSRPRTAVAASEDAPSHALPEHELAPHSA